MKNYLITDGARLEEVLLSPEMYGKHLDGIFFGEREFRVENAAEFCKALESKSTATPFEIGLAFGVLVSRCSTYGEEHNVYVCVSDASILDDVTKAQRVLPPIMRILVPR